MTKPAKNKEQTILEAAEREFLNKGFAGARTTSIAEAAGVTHAMLHYYFRTKEQLFERILDEKMRLMSQSVLTAFGHPDLPRFIVNEVFSQPERYETMRTRIREIAEVLMHDIQQELDASAARGETDRIDVRMLMLDIISLNVFPFIAFPVVEPILGDLSGDRSRFFELRRSENVEIVLRRLKKS